MNNIFFLTSERFSFKRNKIQELTHKEPAKQAIEKLLDGFFKDKHTQNLEYAQLLTSVLEKLIHKENIQKLLHLLVYFCTLLKPQQVLSVLESVRKFKVQSFSLVRLISSFSYVFKSVESEQIRKWLMHATLEEMKKEEKTSPFSSFVENFQTILHTLNLSNAEKLDLYWSLISYLEAHSIYQKLTSRYIFSALKLVESIQSHKDVVDKLLIKATFCDHFDEEAIEVLNQQVLKKHQLYALLEARMTGNVGALEQIKCWDSYKVDKNQITRKTKIESIPRVFKSIRQASYQQAAQMLHINKEQVQNYIIEGIRLGILKAKLDEYEETILINKLNIRCLQKGEQVQLQKQISELCERLQKVK